MRLLVPTVIHSLTTALPTVFSLAAQTTKALFAYQKGNAWQELFTLAISDGKHSPTDIKSLAVEIAGSSSLS